MMLERFAPPPFQVRAPWYGGDLQTLRNTVVAKSKSLDEWPHHSLTIPLDDASGDCLQAEVHKASSARVSAPLVILIHGLTGSAQSDIVVNSAAALLAAGYNVVRLNLRASDPVAHRCTRLSHAGKTDDIEAAIRTLPQELKPNGVVLYGFSLGGNAILKFAGEGRLQEEVRGLVSVSAPINLLQAQQQIHRSRNWIYHRYLVKGMRQGVLASKLAERWKVAVQAVKTIYDFDNEIIAPHHGFSSATDYYQRNSAAAFIPAIKVPGIIIHAADDPWIPLDAYREIEPHCPSNLRLIIARSGGHVGFHAQGLSVAWHDHAALQFLNYLAG